MILISSEFALTQAPADANLPVIGYSNVLTSATLASTTEDADYPLTNLLNPSTFQIWKGTDADDPEEFTFTNSGALDIDFIGIAVHNLGSTGRTIEVTATLDASPVTLLPEASVTSDDPLLIRFTKAAYSEIVITISEAADDTTMPQIAVMYAGELLVLQRKIYVGHTPITYGRQSNVTVGRSTAGNFLGRLVLSEKLKTSVQFQHLTPAWYREFFNPFVRSAIETPFFFAWRPGGYPDEVGYCWCVGDTIPTNQMGNGMMQVSMELEGVA